MLYSITQHCIRFTLWVATLLSVAPTFTIAADTPGSPAKNSYIHSTQPAHNSILNLLPFSDPAFLFQCLWRFGTIASGGGDFGEMLTAAKEVTDNNHESWHRPWFSMADHTEAIASEYLRTGNLVSAQAAFFRAANYYRTSEIYLSPEVPRAMAFEHRIKYSVVDSGVFSVFDGLMTKFPGEVKANIDKDSAEKEINRIVAEEQKKHSDIDQFIKQMLWTFKADSPFQLFRKLKKYSMQDFINKIRSEMLVIGSVSDQVAGSFEQSKTFYSALKSPKTYVEFSDAEGGQFHCQIGVPMTSSERILNWLDDRFTRTGH